MASGIPERLVTKYIPSCIDLLKWLCKTTDDACLTAISKADYGISQERHFADLVRIRDGKDWAKSLYDGPHEVLHLFRLGHFEFDENGLSPAQYHQARAFSCAVLACIPTTQVTQDVLEKHTTLPLVESVFHLEHAPLTELAQFLVWQLEQMTSPCHDRSFVAFLLTLVVGEIELDEGENRLSESFDWLENEGVNSLFHTESILLDGLESLLELVAPRVYSDPRLNEFCTHLLAHCRNTDGGQRLRKTWSKLSDR